MITGSDKFWTYIFTATRIFEYLSEEKPIVCEKEIQKFILF